MRKAERSVSKQVHFQPCLHLWPGNKVHNCKRAYYFFEKPILLACLATWPLIRGEVGVDFILIAELVMMVSSIAYGHVSTMSVTESYNMAAIIQIIA